MSEIERLQRQLQYQRELHTRLHGEVTALEKKVGPTSFDLVDKKRERLRAKDEVTRLERRLHILQVEGAQIEMPFAMASS